MSSESSFDAQVFNEFDDFVPKPHSTDSDCIPSNPESPHAAISSQGPPPPITILPSSQTSIPPATPGISESFCKLDIAPQDTNSLPNRRRRGCPFKRIYARRHTLGKTIAREDALVKPADYITKMSKPRQGRTVGGGGGPPRAALLEGGILHLNPVFNLHYYQFTNNNLYCTATIKIPT